MRGRDREWSSKGWTAVKDIVEVIYPPQISRYEAEWNRRKPVEVPFARGMQARMRWERYV